MKKKMNKSDDDNHINYYMKVAFFIFRSNYNYSKNFILLLIIDPPK